MWLTGPVAPRHVGSSQTRAGTRVPCIGRQIPNHCTTREALVSCFILTFSDCEDECYPKSKSPSRLKSLSSILTTCNSSVNRLFNPFAHLSPGFFVIYYFAEVLCILGTQDSCKRTLTPLYPGLHSVELPLFLKFLFYIEIELINNVVLVSGVQQSDSIIHVHVSALFSFRLLSIEQSIEQCSLCCTAGPCWVSTLNIAV